MKPLSILLSICLLASCFDPDERVLPYPGDIITVTDSVQIYQTWFDLEKGISVKVNRADEWTLAFESSEDGWRIITNSGADWFIYNTQSAEFPADMFMPQGLEGLYDNQRLWPDSTAAGNWTVSKRTYILSRFVNGTFSEQKQVKFIYFDNESYEFIILHDDNTDTVEILKDQSRNFSYYSAESNAQVYPEPDKENYDLLFTSYYDKPTLFGQTIPYKVGGVLLNTRNTAAVLDTLLPYEAIGADIISSLNFSSRRDIPGYDWKNVVVDISGGGSASYSVKPAFNYIIRTAEGNYYKLRFLSYTLDGRSGFPRFEYSQL